jgi:hypothetical protein
MNWKSVSLIFSLLVLMFAVTVGNPVNAQKPAVAAPPGNVTITLDGMEAIFFGASDRVSVGVLNAHNHTPQITITKVVNNQPTIIAQLSGKQLKRSLFIDTEGLAATGIARHQAEAMENDPYDSRWMLNFNELYPQALSIKEEAFFTKIHISSGLFFSNKLSKNKAKFFAIDNSGKTMKFNRRIAAPAAKLNLANGDKLTIKGNFEPIQLVGGNGVQYQIDITNLPPKNAMSMDHFLHYYDIVAEPLPKYVPVFLVKSSFNMAPAPSVCAPVSFESATLSVP